jgi:hypothetical protein
MQKITTAVDLKKTIQQLEIRQTNELLSLKEELYTIHENLKPVNLVKNTFRELTTAPEFKGNILNAVLSIATGYLSKKVVIGSTHNPLKQVLGTILQIGVTSMVSKNTDGIKSVAAKLISTVFSKKHASPTS